MICRSFGSFNVKRSVLIMAFLTYTYLHSTGILKRTAFPMLHDALANPNRFNANIDFIKNLDIPDIERVWTKWMENRSTASNETCTN